MFKRFFTLALIIFPSAVIAHGGGLDGNGCHNDRKRGGYHCHRGELAGQSFNSKSEAQKALRSLKTKKTSTLSPVITPVVLKDIVGTASVIDGDTIEIHGQKIRFHGIDSPESTQLCKTAEGKDYRCGQHAALALSDQIGRKTVTCQQKDTDRYKRIVAVCSVEKKNLNAWMVSQGHALAYRQYSKDYIEHENLAKTGKLGVWQGQFDAPWDWRKAKK